MNLTSEMKSYYNQRANEYEKIYQKPERQEDLKNLGLKLQRALGGHHVLEIACGTGYWTQIISETAKSILASDQSLETLEIARSKNLPSSNVKFIQDDAYLIDQSVGEFTAGFAGFWWSHLPKNRIRGFLLKFHEKMPSGATIVFIDNEFKQGNSTPISRTDSDGNSYQNRILSDGSVHEVLKNFPTDHEFRNALEGLSANVEISRQDYFWMLEYKTL